MKTDKKMETIEMNTLKDLYSRDPESTEIRNSNHDLREFVKGLLGKDGAFRIEGIDKNFKGTIDDTDCIVDEIIGIIIQENLPHLAKSVDLNKRLTDRNNK